jgi:hypothetical protein
MPGMWASGPAIDPSDVRRIAAALERIADALDDVTDNGRLNISGKLVTVEDRP